MRCPYCAGAIAGITQADYLRHIGRCPHAPEQRRIGARWEAGAWQDPRPETRDALVLSVALSRPHGEA